MAEGSYPEDMKKGEKTNLKIDAAGFAEINKE